MTNDEGHDPDTANHFHVVELCRDHGPKDYSPFRDLNDAKKNIQDTPDIVRAAHADNNPVEVEVISRSENIVEMIGTRGNQRHESIFTWIRCRQDFGFCMMMSMLRSMAAVAGMAEEEGEGNPEGTDTPTPMLFDLKALLGDDADPTWDS